MGRAPCCEKMGMKKGPWTPEEDQILISYVQQFGHGNWRALPKQAGLPRCGKSCRLRWMNYLRPDIKRGNFTREEEEIIIKLHQVIGNRWSAIAAKLPGRTDNEIKNVWHTHLKKRLHLGDTRSNSRSLKSLEVSKKESEPETRSDLPVSPQYSTVTTDMSAATTTTTATTTTVTSNNEYFPELQSDDFWAQMLSNNAAFSTPIESGLYPMDYDALATHGHGEVDGRDFWCHLFPKIGEFSELLEM